MLLREKLDNKKVILASKSPRRQSLLKSMDVEFDIQARETDEKYPRHLKAEEIAVFLCKKKAEEFSSEELHDTILITADTIVWLNNKVLDKPEGKEDAQKILKELSGTKHEVITAVCLKSAIKVKVFYAKTIVYFKELHDDEVRYYVDFYQPFDKAGAYGIQEWIGYTGIYHIEGSYYNVMGLPTEKLYEELLRF